MSLRDKSSKLEDFLKTNGINYQSIGIAETGPLNKIEKLYVYLNKKDWTTKKIPNIFMETEVVVKAIGKIEVRA